MIQMLEPMLSEIREETFTTKRVLERVPADKLSWRPHPKSMSLGQLALHVASIPGALARIAQLEEFDAAKATFDPPAPGDHAQPLVPPSRSAIGVPPVAGSAGASDLRPQRR